MIKSEWKKRIYKALRDTLENDLNGVGAGYLFIDNETGEHISYLEENRMRAACIEILEILDKLDQYASS
jgi:hypothetical protein